MDEVEGGEEKKEVKWPEAWEERVGKFAIAVGKTLEEVTEAFQKKIGDPADPQTLEMLSSEESVTLADLADALSLLGITTPKLRHNLKLLRGDKPEKSSTESHLSLGTSLLPVPLDGEAYTNALKVGGQLKLPSVNVQTAIKAAIAERAGYFIASERLETAMEEFAERATEQVTEVFFDIHNLVTQRRYGDILSGVDRRFFSPTRKKALLAKINSGLWKSLQIFNNQLIAWHDSYLSMQQASVLPAIGQFFGGQKSAGLAMIQIPDTSPVHDAAEAVINDINTIFAGFGVYVATALAIDADKIREILAKPELPALVGAVNKDMMIQMLGLAVASDIGRMEGSVVRYTISIFELDKRAPIGDPQEQYYFSELAMLGRSINWTKLLGSGNSEPETPKRRLSGIGREEPAESGKQF